MYALKSLTLVLVLLVAFLVSIPISVGAFVFEKVGYAASYVIHKVFVWNGIPT